MTQKQPTAPKHLSVAARRLWQELFDCYKFSLPASVLLLTQLSESWDHGRLCREQLKGKPLIVVDKHGGVKMHPLAIEARQSREQVSRLARLLRIHIEVEE